MNLFDDFLSLIFPNLCVSCGNSLFKHEEIICTRCDFYLPRTGFHNYSDNPVMQLFTGIIEPENAVSCFYFNKGTHIQTLIHNLKYKGRRDIGVLLGKRYGFDLKTVHSFATLDLIIPVPLHPKKLLERGYNQSEEFAKGLSESLNVPVDKGSVKRSRATETQTRKSRFNRWENVNEIFEVVNKENLENKHVLVVDDVITTGATLQSCYSSLSAVKGIKISLASIAVALR